MGKCHNGRISLLDKPSSRKVTLPVPAAPKALENEYRLAVVFTHTIRHTSPPSRKATAPRVRVTRMVHLLDPPLPTPLGTPTPHNG